MEAFEILVVILSTLLAIFLLLGIVIAVKLLAVVKKVNATVDRIDAFTNSLGANLLSGLRKQINFSAIVSAGFAAARKAYKKREQTKQDSDES